MSTVASHAQPTSGGTAPSRAKARKGSAKNTPSRTKDRRRCSEQASAKRTESSSLARVPTESELQEAVESLCLDQLRPYGRLIRKRLAELASNIHAAPDADLATLKKLCENCSHLHVELEGEADWFVTIRGAMVTFKDIYSEDDTYDDALWCALATYLEELEDGATLPPGGRYVCAQSLISQNLSFLEGKSLGEVSHIVQIAMTSRKLLGYRNGSIVPYARSETAMKEQCAEQQMLAHEAKKPLATWDVLRANLRKLLATEDTGFPLSNVKRVLRARFRVDLSETALGHVSVSELFKDARLQDVCNVRLLDNGYYLFPPVAEVFESSVTSPLFEQPSTPAVTPKTLPVPQPPVTELFEQAVTHVATPQMPSVLSTTPFVIRGTTALVHIPGASAYSTGSKSSSSAWDLTCSALNMHPTDNYNRVSDVAQPIPDGNDTCKQYWNLSAAGVACGEVEHLQIDKVMNEEDTCDRYLVAINNVGSRSGPILGDTLGATLAFTVGETLDSALGETLGSTFDSAMDETFNSTLDSSLGSTLGSTFSSAISDSLGSTLDSTLEEKLDSTLGETLGSTVDSALDESLSSTFGSSSGSTLGSTFGSSLGDALRSALASNQGETFDSNPDEVLDSTWGDSSWSCSEVVQPVFTASSLPVTPRDLSAVTPSPNFWTDDFFMQQLRLAVEEDDSMSIACHEDIDVDGALECSRSLTTEWALPGVTVKNTFIEVEPPITMAFVARQVRSMPTTPWKHVSCDHADLLEETQSMDGVGNSDQSAFQWTSAGIAMASNTKSFTIKNTFVCLDTPPSQEMDGETRRASSCPTTPWLEQALTPSRDTACELKDFADQLRNNVEYDGCSYQTAPYCKRSDDICSGKARSQFQWSSVESSSGLQQSQGLAIKHSYLDMSPLLPCISETCLSRSLPTSPSMLIASVGFHHSPRHVSNGEETYLSNTERSEAVVERVRQGDPLIHSGSIDVRPNSLSENSSAFEVRFGSFDIDDSAFEVRFGSCGVDSTN